MCLINTIIYTPPNEQFTLQEYKIYTISFTAYTNDNTVSLQFRDDPMLNTGIAGEG